MTEINKSGIISGGGQTFSTKGMKLSELKKNNEVLFDFFKSKGLDENSYVYSSDIEKLKQEFDNGDGKFSKRELRKMGLDLKRSEARAVNKALQSIMDTELSEDGAYPVKVDDNTTDFYTKDNIRRMSASFNGGNTTITEYDDTGNRPVIITQKFGDYGTRIDDFSDPQKIQTTTYDGDALIARNGGIVKEELAFVDGLRTKTTTDVSGNKKVYQQLPGSTEWAEVEPKPVYTEPVDVPKEEPVADETAPQKGAVKNTEPQDFTVPKNQDFRSLIIKSLHGQGIENPTKEQIDAEIARFKALNPKAVHTAKNGVEYLYAGDTVKIAGGLKNEQTLPLDSNKQVNTEVQVKKETPVTNPQVEDKQKQEVKTPIYLNGADPNTGKLNDQEYVSVKGRGMCKYNPELKGYEQFTGVHKGNRYVNGEVQILATKELVDPSETADYRKRYSRNYSNGSITPLYKDPTYDSNAQIKIGNKTYELAYGWSSAFGDSYAHADFGDFTNDFVDPDTGALRAKQYIANEYYLVSDDKRLPVTVDMQTLELMVEINGRKVPMNDLMTGKTTI